MGVDNALVELDSNEPPIGDGSAYPYVELINKCGIEQQSALRRTLEVREPLHIETKTGSLLTIVPDNKFKISCTEVGPEGRFTQYYSTEITSEIYEKEIARARTFVFYEDLKPLIDKGLIGGGSLENAIVVRGESVSWERNRCDIRTNSLATRYSISSVTSFWPDAGFRVIPSRSNPDTRRMLN